MPDFSKGIDRFFSRFYYPDNVSSDIFTALQLIFLLFFQEIELRKALIPFIGVKT
jgi:hypothetical protein